MNSFKNFLLNTFYFCRIFNTAKHEKENFAIPIDSCDNLLYFDSREPTRIHSDRSTQFQ